MISIIAAMDKKGLIGKKDKLPWNISEDLQYFKEKTMGKYVIMGEKTFSSMEKDLPGRKLIILSQKEKSFPSVQMASSIKEALSLAKEGEVMIAGGASVYKQFLQIANRMYLTIINKEFEGDVYFPEIEKKEWELKEEKRGSNPLIMYKTFDRVSF